MCLLILRLLQAVLILMYLLLITKKLLKNLFSLSHYCLKLSFFFNFFIKNYVFLTTRAFSLYVIKK
jgi:hypothetical protein